MPHIKYSQAVQNDILRFKSFLLEVAPDKIDEAINTIFDGFGILETNPYAGEAYPLEGVADMRKKVISYGQSGYIGLYTYDEKNDIVEIHGIRHQKELDLIIISRL